MLNLFEKINEFFKDIMIDIIKDNLSAMLVDINDKVSTVAGEVGKTPPAFWAAGVVFGPTGFPGA